MNRLHEIEIQTLVRLNQHGLLDEGWTFQLHRGQSRLGYCDIENKVISISREYAQNAPEAELTDTILHEIAHALTPPIYRRGRWSHHGPEWRATAQAIGCSGNRSGPGFDAPHDVISEVSEPTHIMPIAAQNGE